MLPTIGWSRTFCAVLTAGFFCILIFNSGSTPRAQEITPDIQQRSDDLDVPFVPSHGNVLKAMFDFAKPTKDDFLIDLGSGDGRIVIGAAKSFGTRGFGVDLNEGLVRVARARAERAGVAALARFEVRDLYKTDLRPATILTMYLLPEVVQSLRDRLLTELRPGTRIVSHDYHLGEWRPDASRVVDISPSPDKPEDSVIYFWVVPAMLSGKWQWAITYPLYFDNPVEYSASIAQQFQDIEGSVEVFPVKGRIHDARLSGTRVAFSADVEVGERMIHHDFAGKIDGDRITGTVKLSGSVNPVTLPWSARRTGGIE